MAMLINIPGRPLDKLIAKLTQSISGEEIVTWPNVKVKEKIEFALVWKHQAGTLCDLPNLKGISSFGAGVDSIISDPLLPNVPLARIVDPDLANNMANFVYTMIQHHRLRLNQFNQQQKLALWKPKSPRREKTVGILGLGQLGQTTAQLLAAQGFRVLGWSRTEKSQQGIESFKGTSGLEKMLPHCQYLVCLLPLTSQTKNMINTKMLSSLPNGAVLINVARGEHIVDQDLLDGLDEGRLEAAYLDVFRQEPLPESHKFWQRDNIYITPHVSAVTNVDTAVEQIITNYQRVKSGKPMINCIDQTLGY